MIIISCVFADVHLIVLCQLLKQTDRSKTHLSTVNVALDFLIVLQGMEKNSVVINYYRFHFCKFTEMSQPDVLSYPLDWHDIQYARETHPFHNILVWSVP